MTAEASDTIQCVHCGGTIRAAAKICKHCTRPVGGMPAETLQLALAAEPCLAPGATVVSHNALVFEKSLAPHIARVRAVDGPYSASRSIPAAFGWRGDVMDALEVSTWKG
jgi:hypothetical protein